ncbi:hypothetical protein HPY42_03095 [Coprothermobacteraceae bacterium]|nr:hypothetical protein [Coprothermobacteraceae bacterium]
MDILSTILWLVVLFSVLSPAMHQYYMHTARQALIHSLEKKRHSRVITLIHRQESISLLGLPVARYITMDDSEAVLTAIRTTPPDKPIDLILHTPGGLVLAAEQIALALHRHPAKTTVIIPHYAMSGGTLIALAADEILMDPHAVMGPLDPQINGMPAPSIISAVQQKNPNDVDDQTLILADVSRKAIAQVRDFVKKLLSDDMEESKAEEISSYFCDGNFTHDYPIFADRAKELGLNVKAEVPEEVYGLMMLYPQPMGAHRSVEYRHSP